MTTRRLLILRASGGLSNRLQAVAAGIAYGLLTGRALCVDWRDGIYSDDFSNVFPRWFSLDGPEQAPLPDAAPPEGRVFPPFWKDRLAEPVAVEYLFEENHMAPDNVARTSLDFTCLDYPQEIVVGWGWNLTPLRRMLPLLRRLPSAPDGWSTREPSAEDAARHLLTRHLAPHPEIAGQVEAFAARHFAPGRTIGIHIRHTDLQSPLERMLEALRDLAVPGDTIFLTTDNRHVQTAVSRLFPGVVVTEKCFPPGGVPLHCYVPGISNEQKGREALIDMLLLARCDHIIHYRRSSFARIPALLSGLPPERIHSIF